MAGTKLVFWMLQAQSWGIALRFYNKHKIPFVPGSALLAYGKSALEALFCQHRMLQDAFQDAKMLPMSLVARQSCFILIMSNAVKNCHGKQ